MAKKVEEEIIKSTRYCNILKQDSRYITRGANEKLDLRLQIIL
ncbi:hypothetical protein ACV30V_07440 [Clostridium perfringens]|nr:hypothetical protein [Clostridium perfringens]